MSGPVPYTIDRGKVTEWLNEKWRGSKKCMICGENDWSIGDTASRLGPYYHVGGMVMGGGPIYPLIVVTCINCGYTMLFNGIVMGLVPGEALPKIDAAAEQSSNQVE
jgi:hypothetical protein